MSIGFEWLFVLCFFEHQHIEKNNRSVHPKISRVPQYSMPFMAVCRFAYPVIKKRLRKKIGKMPRKAIKCMTTGTKSGERKKIPKN